MAKSFMVSALIAATALCFSVVLAAAAATTTEGDLHVEGQIYCDPCRVEFWTSISTPISGATVRLTCRNRFNDTVTHTGEGVTENDGKYSLLVPGDHEDDICEVRLVKPSGSDPCNVPFQTTDSARVLITKNVGFVNHVRTASALGYKTTTADKKCNKVLLDMGFPPLEADELIAFNNHN